VLTFYTLKHNVGFTIKRAVSLSKKMELVQINCSTRKRQELATELEKMQLITNQMDSKFKTKAEKKCPSHEMTTDVSFHEKY
jgi:hypothetical protein